jgi:hypothetical protein
MIDFYFAAANGRILMTGRCPKEHVRLQTLPGAERHIGKADAFLQRHEPGVGPVALPAKPSKWHVFDYGAKRWVLEEAAAWAAVRLERDTRLAACDWVALRAQERGEPVPPEWLAYRQALRDITQQPDPAAIAWPVAPA